MSILASRSQHFYGPADPVKASLAAQHFQRFKQRRRFLAAAHRDANRLEHLARFDFYSGVGEEADYGEGSEEFDQW